MNGIMRQIRFLASVAVPWAAVSAPALACTCLGTMDIGTAITLAETVVVGRVERRLDPDNWTNLRPPSPSEDNSIAVDVGYPAPLAVTVIEVLKGDAAGEIRITTDYMCYRSFDLEDIKPGETFVFPIFETAEPGLHILPSCSHSAAKLVDGMLYTNDFVRGGGRRLDPYMSLSVVRVLLPLGLLHRWGQYFAAGVLLMLIPIVITHRIRRRSVLDPVDSGRPLNLRSIAAILWMLVCAGFIAFIPILDRWLLPVVIGVALAVTFALAAAGFAFRWRWTEGISYGLALLWIGACIATIWFIFAEHLEYSEPIGKSIGIFLLIVTLTIIAMLWYADTVRRRFSPSRGPAQP
jgi:hypothetical protein